jgi:hypothetical protein
MPPPPSGKKTELSFSDSKTSGTDRSPDFITGNEPDSNPQTWPDTSYLQISTLTNFFSYNVP